MVNHATKNKETKLLTLNYSVKLVCAFIKQDGQRGEGKHYRVRRNRLYHA